MSMVKKQYPRRKAEGRHPKPPPTPKRLRNSIRLDAIHPRDYRIYNLPFACEDCSHFDSGGESCTLGYNSSLHRRAEQERTYRLNGKMALCRFLEID